MTLAKHRRQFPKCGVALDKRQTGSCPSWMRQYCVQTVDSQTERARSHRCGQRASLRYLRSLLVHQPPLSMRSERSVGR